MGILDLLRGDNDHAKRAFVHKWLDGLEPPDPEPLSPISSESTSSAHHPFAVEVPPTPVRMYKPPSPPPTTRRFDNISYTTWHDPYESSLRTQGMSFQPYQMGDGLTYESGIDYRRVLLPFQEPDSESEGEDAETSGQAGRKETDVFIL